MTTSSVADPRGAAGEPLGSYPGGKGSSGVAQRLINCIPPHRVLVVPFAGHCSVVRKIKPAEHTIVIDADEDVCQWWDSWRRTKQGRALEIHHADGIEWMRHRFGVTEYRPSSPAARSSDAGSRGGRPPLDPATCDRTSEYSASLQTFAFCDPPYVLSRRTGKQYAHEMSDDDHHRFVRTASQITATGSTNMMICGYYSQIYNPLVSWRTFHHEVMTRGGLRTEWVWMNYAQSERLHDYRYLGSDRRERERIQRRQRNWREQLLAMDNKERAAMLDALNSAKP
ncbi:MAG: hypothetical protein KDB00_10885 [Planctomycetales bacterium]|nr:hypothetical protein [Planctomycetales bacterium]